MLSRDPGPLLAQVCFFFGPEMINMYRAASKKNTTDLLQDCALCYSI